ncbi:hypothetical protein HKD37_02G003078 [Glycine soja]|uniref:Uncharacterized protein n=2 Tax=Glycine max TaxID=3847 RepID=A0A0R0KQY7_SOYBN|nr:hypothetical protein JHK87_054827 [Glycine soja]KAG5061879.1 hypothetical protein JHK85_003062 [Glycine max]KAG5078844.1 hypothetical protein JHK86_002909 [Glycine max]
MARNFSLVFTLSSIIFLVTTVLPSTVSSTSTLEKHQVPRIMCDECKLPPPPPPPKPIECPPPPSPPPPIPPSPPPPLPPSPPPPVIKCPPPPKPLPLPPPPPVVVECPPPPKPPCGGGGVDCLLPTFPETPDGPHYLLSPPGLPSPGTLDLDDIINGANMINPLLRYFSLHSFTFLLLLCLPYFLFV